jgi:hypothetical protein
MRRTLLVYAAILFSLAYTTTAVGTELKVSSDLELFYERSKDIGGVDNDDQFKTNGLYFCFDGSFENNMSAKLKVDGSDMVSKDGDLVTENFIEEANFSLNHLGGSPLTLIFGKDEMPFGQDYDKHLTDPITNKFEIDKVWALHAILDLNNFGNLAAALYERRSDDYEITDNFAIRLTMNKLVEGLSCEVSTAFESYPEDMEDEIRYSLGAYYDFPMGLNLNFEYTAFANRKGVDAYDPSLITFGVEYTIAPVMLYTRIEHLDADGLDDVEEFFFMAGVSYDVAPKFTISLEGSNFNTSDLSDASDLMVADGTLEPAVVFGMRAKY